MCRRHYVLRIMRRFDPLSAEALTRRVLATWNSIESFGLANNYNLEPAENIKRWMNKWNVRIGGSRESATD